MNATEEIEVLLVEDNPDDAEIAMRTLRRHNLANRLVWVKDGAEALDYLFGTGEFASRADGHLPRLVLLDLKLPKVDGLEVLERIRAEARTRTLPVVMLTSSTQDEDVVRSYQLGVNSYVSKPVQFERFAEVVAKLGMYWLLINRAPPPGDGQ
jgi:two-component system, response regulator